MNLQEHYHKLYQDSIRCIQADAYQIDELIDATSDNRFGITLLLRPDDVVKEEIQKLLSKLKLIEPNQYFYRDSDLHVTVMSIISCYNGFDLGQIRVEDYVKTVRKSIHGLGPFEVEFKGLTASPSCLMVQGFLADNTLSQLRDNLRSNFRDSGLEQSIDKRYSIQTAHSTVVRFKEKLRNKDEFLRVVENHRDHSFGTSIVNTIELVYNDWYQRKEYVKTLCKFEL
ncbi:mutarotase [uncultured Pontibacter sp.]|uniref:2'-5' RNA ligase family protein n=1 Tax=uncultured Pontibacter sp. TaxID=453356 RepID=UPI002612A213|nr:mutarotase [uncultured Pontibacter sp.]